MNLNEDRSIVTPRNYVSHLRYRRRCLIVLEKKSGEAEEEEEEEEKRRLEGEEALIEENLNRVIDATLHATFLDPVSQNRRGQASLILAC